jgi:FtsH-binding integral membrane protein
MLTPYRTSTKVIPHLEQFATKVYSWMAGLLLLTASTSFLTNLLGGTQWLRNNPFILLGLFVAEIVLVTMFATLRRNLSYAKGLTMVLVYTTLNGVTLSTALSQYHITTVAIAFFASAGIFVLATLYGILGKRLFGIEGWTLVGLLGIIVMMIVNTFIGSQVLETVISCVTVLLFTGLAALHTQTIELRSVISPTNLDALDCALEVYLDFLNIFLAILRLFGIYSKDR